MDWASIIGQALLAYIFFIPLLTFHEWAHAWTAWKCGDDTAYKRGRVSLNPIVHMELIGTVILPLAGLLTQAFGMPFLLIGWGKPVPVDPGNLKSPRLQDSLIAMAGPAMNILLALVLLAAAKLALAANQPLLTDYLSQAARLSLVLCFFNLLPIPPLDGSHLILNLTRMSYETFYRLSQVGFIAIIILIQFRFFRQALTTVVEGTYVWMVRLFFGALDKM